MSRAFPLDHRRRSQDASRCDATRLAEVLGTGPETSPAQREIDREARLTITEELGDDIGRRGMEPYTVAMKKPARLRFRLLLGGSTAIGPGKADLLAGIVATGSISAAGRAMGMSYKKAWYLIDTMNRCFREPLVEASKGGRAGGGARLTPTGEEVLSRYRKLETRAGKLFARELEEFNRLVVSPSSEK